MGHHLHLAAAVILLALPAAAPASAQMLPQRVGACVQTTVAEIGSRLVDGSTNRPIPGSGSAIRYANRGAQVSYDEVPEIARSRVGDRVKMCLVEIPRGCPPGDARGRIYRVTNERTGESWTLPDAEHRCGGA